MARKKKKGGMKKQIQKLNIFINAELVQQLNVNPQLVQNIHSKLQTLNSQLSTLNFQLSTLNSQLAQRYPSASQAVRKLRQAQ